MKTFVLVYWEEEESVSAVVPATHVRGEVNVGEVCDVLIQQKDYPGREAATGKPIQ